MIVRIWHGRTLSKDAAAYKAYVEKTGIPEYLRCKGNLGTQIWQREEGDITHIWTISWWKSLEHIKEFAGSDIEKAQYYEKDKEFLLEFEEKVIHAEASSYSNHIMD